MVLVAFQTADFTGNELEMSSVAWTLAPLLLVYFFKLWYKVKE